MGWEGVRGSAGAGALVGSDPGGSAREAGVAQSSNTHTPAQDAALMGKWFMPEISTIPANCEHTIWHYRFRTSAVGLNVQTHSSDNAWPPRCACVATRFSPG